ncbi:hypothetical protein [Brevibacillus daliensis]|uniref:hypothetical protein n=1 Tax=Brevibacillus daliensis TaxID=2892995 RepID=UPI001E3C8535|nr:hypothetical protein [Brevibacillus daliensis]
MSRIRLELAELYQALSEITQLIGQLRNNERHVATQNARLEDWHGLSANELRLKMNSFFSELKTRISRLEVLREELIAYIQMMERLDQED